MKRLLLFSFLFIFCMNNLMAQKSSVVGQQGRIGTSNETDAVMSEAYWKHWNSEVQARIDRDIEQYRKATAILTFEEMPVGSEVKVEQVSHDFIFGAHIFNFNQLGTVERNQKYKELFGTLFNSATIAFYWKTFEMQPNRLRFKEEYWDTEEYWNQLKEPELEPHWRRPASDPVVEFCESKGIRLHGHTITWGEFWHYPDWQFEQFCPQDEKEKINNLSREELYKLTPSQIETLIPKYTNELNRLMHKRIIELATYYDDRIHSWDVVNESLADFSTGQLIPGDKICKSYYGKLMPGDYTFESFKTADRVFPENVLLNINDNAHWNKDWDEQMYVNQIKDMIARGSRINIMGSHEHLFNPQACLDIAAGKSIKTPEQIWEKMRKLSTAGLPIHVSEITITSPGDVELGREIQAVITRNLYRLWFSIEKMMGITWWNVVDGCGAPGETTISGLFTRNMEPKPAFCALNKLINEEWKTNDIIKVKEDGTVTFRGFKGRYIISWKDKLGKMQQAEFYLKNDGDGLHLPD